MAPSPTLPLENLSPTADAGHSAAKTLAHQEVPDIPPHLEGKLDPNLPVEVIEAILDTTPNQLGKRRKGGAGRTARPAEIRDLARSFCPEAMATLVNLMRTAKDGKVKMAAATALLDRGYGKVNLAEKLPEEKTVDGEVLSDEELDRTLAS